MREIKFRGMDIKGNWYYGLLSKVPQKYHTQSIPAGVYISNAAGKPFAYRVRPETVGQYIELEDKRTKQAYEGDIVLMNDEACIKPNVKLVIEYFFGIANAHPVNDRFYVGDIHELCRDGLGNYKPKHGIAGMIIGNIHENPELLN